MNIGIDIRCLLTPSRTGVGEYASELLTALFKIDQANQYFLFYNAAGEMKVALPRWPQENVRYVGSSWPNKLFNTSLHVLRQPKLDRFAGHRSAGTGLDAWFSPNLSFTALSPRTRHILTIHDLSFEYFPDCYSWQRRLWHKILNPKRQCVRADIILTPSEHTQGDVIERYGIEPKKVWCVYPGLSGAFSARHTSDLRAWRQKYQLPEKFILFLGTIEPRKNILGLIEAYKQSLLFNVHCALIIAGAIGWKHSAIMTAIESTPGVRYIGYVTAADKPGLYQLAKLFVYPSLYEGFGFPVLEAMASGTPVITSNRSSLPEVAGAAGYLVNPYNVSELARAMSELLASEQLRSIFIERGKDQAQRFQWERAARQVLDAISAKG